MGAMAAVGGCMAVQTFLASLVVQYLRMLRQLLANEVFLAHLILDLLQVLLSKLVFDFW